MHPYLLQLVAAEHVRGMRSVADAARLARQAQREAARDAGTQTAAGLLGVIPRPRQSAEVTSRAA